MALETLSKQEENRIIRNLALAITEDIELLDNNGYRFIHICSGFIAHYNLEGFIGNYSSWKLAQDILANQSGNQYRNFRKGERDYEYMMQKKRMYNKICGIAQGDRRFKIPSGDEK